MASPKKQTGRDTKSPVLLATAPAETSVSASPAALALTPSPEKAEVPPAQMHTAHAEDLPHAPVHQYSGFEFANIPWSQSLFAKLFGAFLVLALLPTVISSLLIAAAYHVLLNQYVPEHEVATLTSNMQVQFFLIVFFIVILVTFISFVISRGISRPIKLLIMAVQKISDGDLSVHIKINRKDELGNLAHFFNTMVDKLKEIQERNVEISKLKSQFVSVAAHQLRTPLSAVKWTLRLLLDGDVGKMSREQEDFLERGYQTNERMINLVNDLLDVSRIEEGRFGYNFQEVEIADVIRKAVAEVSIVAAKRNIKINFRQLIHEDLEIIADPERVHTIIINLLDNAVNYSEPGDEVVVTAGEEGDLLKVSIEDNGIGIPDSEFDKVFSRFYRASNAVRLQTDGSGLGLFIVQNIIHRHGGRVWFESKEGQGTSFFFTLPMQRDLIKKSI